MALAAARSEPPALSADPARAARSAARGLPATIFGLQRSAGNAAVARAIAPRAIQRCGSGCGCSSCGHEEDELLDEQRGAGLLRSAVAGRSA